MPTKQPSMASWNMDVLCQHTEPGDRVVSIAVSNKEEIIATRGLLNRIYIWDLKKRTMTRAPNADTPEDLEALFAIAFHPSLPYFAYVETKGTVCVAQMDTWDRLATLANVEDYAIDLIFDPRSSRVAVGCFLGHIIVWDIPVNTEVTAADVYETPFRVSFSHDSSLVSAFCDDRCCRIIAAESGGLTHQLVSAEGKFEDALFSPSHPFLLTVSSLGQIASWDVGTFRLRFQRSTGLTNTPRCAVAQTKPFFAVRSGDGPVVIWDYLEDVVVARIDTPPGVLDPICFSANGQYLLVGGKDQCVRSCPLFGVE